MRLKPCSSFTIIISTAMMASSTSSPSAMIRAPSEMRWKSMPSSSMPTKVMARTSGTDRATMMPVRTPRLTKDTTSTMASASSRDEVNSSKDLSTTSGWLATRCTVMPTGRSRSISAIAASSALPSVWTLPPGAMTTPRPITSLPLNRIESCSGSW